MGNQKKINQHTTTDATTTTPVVAPVTTPVVAPVATPTADDHGVTDAVCNSIKFDRCIWRYDVQGSFGPNNFLTCEGEAGAGTSLSASGSGQPKTYGEAKENCYKLC